jgi:hypothetical protein
MWSEDKRAKQCVDLLEPTSFSSASNQPTALYLHIYISTLLHYICICQYLLMSVLMPISAYSRPGWTCLFQLNPLAHFSPLISPDFTPQILLSDLNILVYSSKTSSKPNVNLSAQNGPIFPHRFSALGQ